MSAALPPLVPGDTVRFGGQSLTVETVQGLGRRRVLGLITAGQQHLLIRIEQTGDEERVVRVIERDHTDADGVRARMRAQIDPGEARALATYTIENDGDLAQLHARANAVYDALLELR